ncbi:c-type cytochrome [Bacteroidia bacterium]|nr:c-type cytochrome [Bacteroidia bacterium]MDB4107745.1 c-type cytochrome [Bacteroidia bacterium]MDB9881662.1 c-type cytochrome [Bacteroidia bacterium]
MKLNTLLKYGLVLALPAISLVSCVSSGDNPGIEYAPNMYTSQAYEPFSQEKSFDYNPNGMTMRLPVNGTIARGQGGYIYPHANNGEGYEASASYTPWIAATESNVAEGERLYNIYCWHCHGKKGKNDGPIFKDKKMPGPSWPAYSSDYIKELPNGKIYHTITNGKGLMGSHSFMLNPEERWKVIHYVKSLAFGDDFKYAAEHSSANGDHGDMGSPQTSSANFPGTPEEKARIMTAMSKVDFKGLPNRKEMKSSSHSSLDEVAAYLSDHPDYKTTIVGHIGVTLTEEGAATLGIDRATKVINYLTSKGVKSSNLSARSDASIGREGEITSSEDRKSNRRVEIEIYK